MRLASIIVIAHLGLVLLTVLASGWRAPRNERAPEIDRDPVSRSARDFVGFFALAPALAVVGLLAVFGSADLSANAAPLILLSGLFIVVLAGDRIRIYRERVVSFSWLGLLLAPPLLAVMALLFLPWIVASDLRAAQPAASMGRFFADSFQRRTGRPLAIVGGDEQLASLVAQAAPSRPSLYLDRAPERSPWIDAEAIRQNGAILVWRASESDADPPASLKTQFPGLSPELPRAFPRPVQGRLPLIRVGWAIVRPQATPTVQPSR